MVEEGEIRLPFSSLAGVGEAAAFSLREARETGGEYISIDDLQARAKVSSAVIDTPAGSRFPSPACPKAARPPCFKELLQGNS